MTSGVIGCAAIVRPSLLVVGRDAEGHAVYRVGGVLVRLAPLWAAVVWEVPVGAVTVGGGR